ncbi:MAG: hypothetical protein JXA74_14225 [Anaerolineae bacterium]|nr:hypothetical protein [Anaerolineae bacterium]
MDTQPSSFARTWWGNHWLQAVARLVSSERLDRGRAYARLGQVSGLEVHIGLILASVKGARSQPYSVRIEVETLSDAQWASVIEALADRALYAAELLSGEMPPQIEAAFQAAGASLFPARPYEFRGHCGCSDPARPCKHVAATCYAVAERLDEDPWALLALRGRTREQILVALRRDRTARLEAGPGPAPLSHSQGRASQALAASADRFWQIGPEANGIEIRVRAPDVETELLKILGDPTFAQHEGLTEEIAQVYRQVSQQALRLAFGSSDSSPLDIDEESA